MNFFQRLFVRAERNNIRRQQIAAEQQEILEAIQMMADGVWECSGPPFWDPQAGEWCQNIVRRLREPAAGTVNLREVKRR